MHRIVGPMFDEGEDDAKSCFSPSPRVFSLPCEHGSVVKHTRKLPPPFSRGAVQRQFGKLGGWVNVQGDDSDLMVATRKRTHCEVFCRDHSPEFDSEEGKVDDSDTYNLILASLRSRDSKIPPQSHQQKPTSPPPPKKRLALSDTAYRTADESAQENDLGQGLGQPDADEKAVRADNQETSLVNTSADALNQRRASPRHITSTAFDEATDDEGPFANTPNPATEEDRENDDSVVNELLHVHKTAPYQRNKQVPHNTTQIDDADWALLSGRKAKRLTKRKAELQANSEAQYAMRSKQLREGTLNEFEPKVENNTEKLLEDVDQPASFLKSTLASINHSTSRHDQPAARVALRAQDLEEDVEASLDLQSDFRRTGYTPAFVRHGKDTTRARASPDPNELLDYTSGFVNARRAPRLVPIRHSGFRRHRLSFNSALNPASRLAAEKWQTQNRHTEHDPSHALVSGHTQLEARLLAAQRGGSNVITTPDAGRFNLVSVLGHHEDGTGADRKIPEEAQSAHTGNSPSPTTIPYQPAKIAQDIRARRIEDREPVLPLAKIADIDITDVDAIKTERFRLREQGKDLEALKKAYTGLAIIQAHRNLTEQELGLFERLHQYAGLVLDEGRSAKASRLVILQLRDRFQRHAVGLLDPQSPELTFEILRTEIEQFLTPRRTAALEEALKRIPALLTELKELADQQHQKAIQERKAEKSAARNREKEGRTVQQAVPRRVRFTAHDARISDDMPRGVSKSKKTQRKEKKVSRAQLLQDKLALFKAACPEREQASEDGTASNNNIDAQNDDNSSETSEEDAEGKTYYGTAHKPPLSFMAPAPFGPSSNGLAIVEEQDLDEISKLEEQRQKEELDQITVDGQAFDERLALENKFAALERREAAEEKEKEEDLDDLQSEVSSLASDSSSEDQLEPHQANQYSVRATYRGLDIYHDDDEYGYGRYLDCNKAEVKLTRIISSMKEALASTHGRDFDLTAKIREGFIAEQTLTMGDNLTAKVWIEKRIVNLSKRQAKKARELIPVEVGHNWIVDWKKEITSLTTTTTTTTTTTAARVSSPAPIDATVRTLDREDDDDLFGNFSTPPPPPPQYQPPTPTSPCTKTPTTTATTTTTESKQTMLPSALELDLYSTAHHANLRAKQVYLDWYATFCPVHERPSMRYPEYAGMLGQTERALAEEVERASGVEGAVVGPWVEELERPEVEEEQQEEEKEDQPDCGGDDHGSVVKRLVRLKVTERMTVQVVRNCVKGPRN